MTCADRLDSGESWICPMCEYEVDYELRTCPNCGWHEMEEDEL